MGMTATEANAARKLIDAARKVNRLRLELVEAERMQSLATKQLERAMKAAHRQDDSMKAAVA
jgi:hypothetical protein